MNRTKKGLRLFLVLAVFGLPLASGCATNGSLSEGILRGDEAIRKAAESNARVNAPGELKAAEEKLVRAKQAAYKRDYDEATRLTEQASIDAEYARHKAASEKTRKTAEQLRQDIKALRQEVDSLSKQ
jgi:septal ring factor EnvC (AmiA/AmiB activator)